MPHQRSRSLPLDFYEQPFIRSYVEQDPETGALWRIEIRGVQGIMVKVRTPMPTTPPVDRGQDRD